jgi:PmbA protein
VTAPAAATPVSLERITSVAASAVERAQRAGAGHAEAYVTSGRSFSVEVQNGAVETLKQSATHGLGLRVIVDHAVGFVSTNDFRPDALDDLIRRAVALARHSTPDEANVLPVPNDSDAHGDEDLAVFDPAVLEFAPETKIALAHALERAALAHDPRIRRTDGASVSSNDGGTAVVNSNGVSRAWLETAVSARVLALAEDGPAKQQTGYYGVARRAVATLPPPEAIAREAGRRAVARIGAKPVPTARVPVVFHPDIGAAWLSDLHDAFSGESVIKKSSWLTGRLGDTIASPLITLVDDGRLREGLGSEPFDGEGVATRRNVLIERGVCARFEYDTYHARRAGTAPTGSAVRGYSSTPSIGMHNLYVVPGAESPEAILARVDRGFYMDDQGSFGFNPVTGDYSYQAQGFWVEKGEKRFPVEGVTVASNSLDMLKGIVAVGSDLVWDHGIACPTLLIAEMTVSGTAA